VVDRLLDRRRGVEQVVDPVDFGPGEDHGGLQLGDQRTDLGLEVLGARAQRTGGPQQGRRRDDQDDERRDGGEGHQDDGQVGGAHVCGPGPVRSAGVPTVRGSRSATSSAGRSATLSAGRDAERRWVISSRILPSRPCRVGS
jgi:hypothetical protein